MLNIKKLLEKILKILTFKSGVTMTGELLNSNGAVAIGSGQVGEEAGLTITEVVNQLRYSSGAVGSVKINSSTADGITFSGWYNYIYIPHRNGGRNGFARFTDGADNHSYGNLILFAMTASNTYYDIRIASNSIQNVYKWNTNEPVSGGSLTRSTTTNYSLNTTLSNYVRFGRLVIVSLNLQVNSPANWASSAIGSGLPATYDSKEVYGALCSSEDHSAVSIAIQSDGSIKAGGGNTNVSSYSGTIYYMTTSD